MGPDLTNAETWALVMNASRVRVLRGLTDDAPAELINTCPARRLRSVLSGAPAEATDVIGGDLSEFVRETLRCLEILRRAGDFRYLALVAPTPVLSCTSVLMPQQLGAGVRWRQAADLITLPEAELRSAVRQLVQDRATP